MARLPSFEEACDQNLIRQQIAALNKTLHFMRTRAHDLEHEINRKRRLLDEDGHKSRIHLTMARILERDEARAPNHVVIDASVNEGLFILTFRPQNVVVSSPVKDVRRLGEPKLALMPAAAVTIPAYKEFRAGDVRIYRVDKFDKRSEYGVRPGYRHRTIDTQGKPCWGERIMYAHSAESTARVLSRAWNEESTRFLDVIRDYIAQPSGAIQERLRPGGALAYAAALQRTEYRTKEAQPLVDARREAIREQERQEREERERVERERREREGHIDTTLSNGATVRIRHVPPAEPRRDDR